MDWNSAYEPRDRLSASKVTALVFHIERGLDPTEWRCRSPAESSVGVRERHERIDHVEKDFLSKRRLGAALHQPRPIEEQAPLSAWTSCVFSEKSDIFRKMDKGVRVSFDWHDRPPGQMPPKPFPTVQDPALLGREAVITPL
jgi:hypothetical protein